ncbi:methyl-accepting chemotaxis protein [Geomonas sp. Red32]|uniref:methyl-accepting chemotaxis protein n=1 Tax=Geomonas sp. Red32 TaxID=2912856 RepID=UPI00202CD0C0|nr:methyl-accepting chemotaxis protein [Geomonas sp. Red32]MCM0081726.1 methyl-accepting chemotaxis protein [Geomonas sp. Red32]
MKMYKDWGIFAKVMSLSLLTWLVLLVATTFILVPYLRGIVMTEKKLALRYLVEEAVTVLADYERLAATGVLTKEAAQKEAADKVKRLRYDKKEYFFINDLNCRLVANPLRPEMEGKDMSSFRDADGKAMYPEFTKAATGPEGGGYVDYRQIKPNESKPQPKLSYTKLFQPWGWVIGTGVYISEVNKEMRAIEMAIGGGLFLVLLLGLGLAWGISRSIARPVNAVVESIKDIAQGEGDLIKRLPIQGNNEVGELCRWFNTFVEKLHGIVTQVSGSADQLSGSAEAVESASRQMASGVGDLTTRVLSLSTAGEQMAATSSDIAGNCHEAAGNARSASERAAQGAEVVGASIFIMNAIAQRVQSAAQTVATLGNRSDQIGTIVGTIEEIADQTNLLALNAAIEAARAGEQGRGFAVVADEVRALAERTTRATREIGEMIKAIQQETREAVKTMESSVQQVQDGSSNAAASGEALQHILEIITSVTEQISRIATAAEEQTATTRQISHNVATLNEMAGANNAAIGGTEEASRHVREQAGELKRLVHQFRV